MPVGRSPWRPSNLSPRIRCTHRPHRADANRQPDADADRQPGADRQPDANGQPHADR